MFAETLYKEVHNIYCEIFIFSLFGQLFVDDIENMIETAKNTPFPRNDIKPLMLESALGGAAADLWLRVSTENFDPFNKWSLMTSALLFLKGYADMSLFS